MGGLQLLDLCIYTLSTLHNNYNINNNNNIISAALNSAIERYVMGYVVISVYNIITIESDR